MDETKPTPGSDVARLVGCKCPIFDNNRGQTRPPSGWYINERCPVHGDGRELAPA